MPANCLVLAVVVLAVGCGGPHNAVVEGQVTLDGTPLPNGTVTFKPTAEGTTAYGSIDEGGNYRLQTGREYGLAAGEYKVTVAAREKSGALYGKNGGPPPAGKQLTPSWYRSLEHSGLQFTVEPGSNEIDLPLTSEPPAGWQPQQRQRKRR